MSGHSTRRGTLCTLCHCCGCGCSAAATLLWFMGCPGKRQLEHGADNTKVVNSIPIYLMGWTHWSLWVPSDSEYSMTLCESCHSNGVGRDEEVFCPPLCWPSKCRYRTLSFLSEQSTGFLGLCQGRIHRWVNSICLQRPALLKILQVSRKLFFSRCSCY